MEGHAAASWATGDAVTAVLAALLSAHALLVMVFVVPLELILALEIHVAFIAVELIGHPG